MFQAVLDGCRDEQRVQGQENPHGQRTRKAGRFFRWSGEVTGKRTPPEVEPSLQPENSAGQISQQEAHHRNPEKTDRS